MDQLLPGVFAVRKVDRLKSLALNGLLIDLVEPLNFLLFQAFLQSDLLLLFFTFLFFHAFNVLLVHQKDFLFFLL
jgi:hypothetical protein